MRDWILFTDVGDTIIDEGSEVHDGALVLRADCIPGAAESYRRLHEMGIPMVMVADGLTQSFRNTLGQHGLWELFEAHITSEEVGEEKPSPRMFEAAMAALGLTEADKPRLLMVGNNPARDIAGANRFGITSIQMDWSPRYPQIGQSAEEQPVWRIHTPAELPPLLERLRGKE